MLFKKTHTTEQILTTTSSPQECVEHLLNYGGWFLNFTKRGENHFYAWAMVSYGKISIFIKTDADVYISQNEEGITEIRFVPCILIGKKVILIICGILSLFLGLPFALQGAPWYMSLALFGFGFIPMWFWFILRIQDEGLYRSFRDYMLFGIE